MFISDVYGKSPMYEVADRDNDKSLVYEVIDPGKLFRSRTYADYLEEFWNWLYTVNCDRYNIGDVAFLRGISFGTDPKKGYVGGPVLNVGGNALTISIEQGLFFCNTTTNVEAINEREQYSEALLLLPALHKALFQENRAARISDKNTRGRQQDITSAVMHLDPAPQKTGITGHRPSVGGPVVRGQ